MLLGVKAVISESFKRIHRANLVGKGVLSLNFVNGESAASLELYGTETCDLAGLKRGASELTMQAKKSRRFGEYLQGPRAREYAR